jgi:ATP-dependent Clp protease ATP-binding subunit ClpC
MPSSKDRRRIEVSTELYDRLKQIADGEERTVTSVLHDLLRLGLAQYHPTWLPRLFMDRFDSSARGALELAKEEARQLGIGFVGTEHVLLGLIREEHGIAAQVLRHLWIDLEKARAALAYILTRQPVAATTPPAEAPVSLMGDEAEADEDIGFTLRARKVFALAVDEAQRLGDDHVGTEHLLLAIEREGEGLAAGLLQTFGALGKVREFTLAQIAQRAREGTTKATATGEQAAQQPPAAL